MVHLNKNKLTKSQEDQLFTQLGSFLGKLDKPSTQTCLKELLGKEERMMLAKRLATIILLLEAYSEYKISRILKLSPSTVNKVSENLKLGNYNSILQALGKSKVNYALILETIDSILHLGGILPHRSGLERYRGIR